MNMYDVGVGMSIAKADKKHTGRNALIVLLFFAAILSVPFLLAMFGN